MRQRTAETHKLGRVTKVLKAEDGQQKAHIQINKNDPLYGELRIANILQDSTGKRVHLREGDIVDFVIRTDEDSTDPKE
jgi:hypothetical protein